MTKSLLKNTARLFLCFVILGSFGPVRAADQDSQSVHYRQEVRDRLKKLQANLDLLYANHQLSLEQYQTDSERVRQLRIQAHADAQENIVMTRDDRNTDLGIIRQINLEANQWAAANGASVSPTDPLAVLQSQYATLNDQYQALDNQYAAAVSAKDLQTAQTTRVQLDALRQQMDNVRSRMQQQISPTPNP